MIQRKRKPEYQQHQEAGEILVRLLQMKAWNMTAHGIAHDEIAHGCSWSRDPFSRFSWPEPAPRGWALRARRRATWFDPLAREHSLASCPGWAAMERPLKSSSRSGRELSPTPVTPPKDARSRRALVALCYPNQRPQWQAFEACASLPGEWEWERDREKGEYNNKKGITGSTHLPRCNQTYLKF